MAYSQLLKRHYDPSNSNVLYLSNVLQVAKYLQNGASEFLVDILYDGVKREDTLVFVFLKTPEIQELYKKWQEHTAKIGQPVRVQC